MSIKRAQWDRGIEVSPINTLDENEFCFPSRTQTHESSPHSPNAFDGSRAKLQR